MRAINTGDAVRALCAFLLATGLAALAIAVQGWSAKSLALGGMIVLTGGLLVMQIRRAIGGLHDHSDRISRSARQAEAHYIDVLRRIVRLVEDSDRYIQGHSERVGALAEKIGLRMGMSAAEAHQMRLAGELHDIGMLAVPAKISAERCRIGVDEFRTITKHSQAGFEVLRPLSTLLPVLPAVLYHHERMNGTGYPEGLSGEEIPVSARILAVADSYDAMTHDRPHRPAMTNLSALKELERCCPAGYDTRIVEALNDVLGIAKLSDSTHSAQTTPAGHSQEPTKKGSSATVLN